MKAPRSTGKLVLIVDDDPDARQILGGIVRALGLNTTVTSSGKEALDAIRNNPPDLVLLDLMMPGMDGFEVLFRLRSIPSTRHVPVIVVSAYSVGQQDLLRLPGVAEVIKKGQFEIVELQKSVSSILKPPTAAFST